MTRTTSSCPCCLSRRCCAQATVEAALDNVLGEVRRHVPKGRFTDDLAVLLLENAGGRDEQLAVDPRDSLVSSPAPMPPRPASQDGSTAQPAPDQLR